MVKVLSKDGAYTDFEDFLGVNSIKGDLSIDTTFDTIPFSLDHIFLQRQFSEQLKTVGQRLCTA